MDTDSTRLVHLNLPRNLLDQLREVADRKDRSVTAETKTAIRRHLAIEHADQPKDETS
jgi:hypothetical protein